jgi:hypothetical protein
MSLENKRNFRKNNLNKNKLISRLNKTRNILRRNMNIWKDKNKLKRKKKER